MEVILLEKIRSLGTLGDKVKIRPGYGRNFLIPRGKAVRATKENIAKFEARRTELEKIAAENLSKAQQRAQAFVDLTITISALVAEEGRLYGSVGTHDIAEALDKVGHPIAKSEIILSDGPIKQVGEHTIKLQLHSDIICPVKLVIVPQE